MFKLAIGFAGGFALGSKLGEGGLEDLLQIVQQTLGNEQIAELVRAGTSALGDAVRMLGVFLTEEAPTRLGERAEIRELRAS
jgi:hypothetical protein